MKLLPSQQTDHQLSAFQKFLEAGKLTLCEPCDCGGQIRHNNGGNYHRNVSLRMDGGACWRSETTTSDYDPGNDWQPIGFGVAIEEIATMTAEGWSY